MIAPQSVGVNVPRPDGPPIRLHDPDRKQAVLGALQAHGQPLHVTILQAVTGIPRSALYRTLDKLSQDGQIVRENGVVSLVPGGTTSGISSGTGVGFGGT